MAEILPYAGRPTSKLLFIDRFHLYALRGLNFHMHQPAKVQQNPIIVPAHAWEGWRSFPYARAILHDPTDSLYKMWYETQYDGQASGPWEAEAIKRMAYATSTDGLHWSRPNLGQVMRDGSTANSLIAMGPFGMHFANVILDDAHDPDPARRFKMMFWAVPPGKGKGELPMGATVAVSPDGITWTMPRAPQDLPFPGRHAWRPGRATAADAVSLVGWVEQQQRYVAFLKSNDLIPQGFRTICYTESPDFINWSRLVSVLAPDEVDPWGTEFYYMTVFPYGELYVGLLSVYHNYSRRPGAWGEVTSQCPPELAYMDQRMDVRLAFSRDLQVWWQAGSRQAFIPVGEVGTWDQGMIFGSTLLDKGDETWVYYGGSPMRHVRDDLQVAGQEINGQIWGIFGGLAKLRRDGFVSLQAGNEPGELITRPVFLTGIPLRINARTHGAGEISVRLMDRDQRYLENVPAMSFQGDAVDAALSLPASILAPLAPDQPVRLHITCRYSDLFAIQL